MKKTKRFLIFLLTSVMLCAASVTCVFASTYENVFIDLSNETESNDGIMTLNLGTDNSFQVNGTYRFDYFWNGLDDDNSAKTATALKYIENDNERLDSGGNKWRFVYCLEHDKSTPNGKVATWTSMVSKKEITYVLLHGPKFWVTGESPSWANGGRSYSTYQGKDFKQDYYIAQMALHIVNGEFTSAQWYSWAKDNSTVDKDYIKGKIDAFVKAAKSASNYTGFTDNYVDMSLDDHTYAVSGSIKTWTKSGSKYVSNWLKPTFQLANGFDFINYVKSISNKVTVSDDKGGISIVKEEETTHSRFRLEMSTERYEELTTYGGTITLKSSMTVPKKWQAGSYTPPDIENLQKIALFTYSGDNTKKTVSKEVTFAPETGAIALMKASANPDVTDENDSYSLGGAVYNVYKQGTDTQVGEIVTDADGAGKLEGLPLGSYEVREATPPAGYCQDEKTYVVTLEDTENENPTVTLEVEDEPYLSPVRILIRKVQSGTEIKIPGAVFEHERPNGETETVTTDENGNLSFTELELGKHYVREISAPDGYFVNCNEIEFVVKQDNTIEVKTEAVETDQDGNIYVAINTEEQMDIVVEDKPTPYQLQVVKKNEQGEYLEGAEFTLYADANLEDKVDTQVSGKDGIVKFCDLIVGYTYYLKETKAPIGYALPKDDAAVPIYVEAFLDETASDRVVHLTVTNQQGMLLPNTGSSGKILLLLGGHVLMLTGVLASDKKRKHS